MTNENAPPSDTRGPPRGRNKRITALSEEAGRDADFVENITKEKSKMKDENIGKTIRGLSEIILIENKFLNFNLALF